jgi:cell division protein FtsL
MSNIEINTKINKLRSQISKLKKGWKKERAQAEVVELINQKRIAGENWRQLNLK